MLVLDADDVERAVAALDRGELVAIPTDTVYGLAASCTQMAAVERLYEAKGRPADLPIAVLCATEATARDLASVWTPLAARLTARFWPGPLTVVVEVAASLAPQLVARGGVGLRVPADEPCRRLLAETGPLAVTSANRHGEPPCTRPAEVVATFGGHVVAVVDGGVRDGAVSTVVDARGDAPSVLRAGAIGADALLDDLSER